MEYVSVDEMAKTWGISPRGVRNYCAQGRIADAVLRGKTWMIPAVAVKPKRKPRFDQIPQSISGILKLENGVGDMETCPTGKVHAEISRLLAQYNASRKTFEDIVDFHVKFEGIHPFQDGNGRVGRLIMLKECLKNGHVPFVICENLKQFYYIGLEDWRHGRRARLLDTCRTGQDVFILGLRQFGHKRIAAAA